MSEQVSNQAGSVPWEKLGVRPDELGIVIVDHGSRREASNQLLLQVVDVFREQTGYKNVQPAHMELAEPSIAAAFQTVVAAGAKLVVVFPYFLSPGRHWAQDIPALAAEASVAHGVRYLVTSPLGLHPLMSQIMQHRIQHCLSHAVGETEACDVCRGENECVLRQKDGE